MTVSMMAAMRVLDGYLTRWSSDTIIGLAKLNNTHHSSGVFLWFVAGETLDSSLVYRHSFVTLNKPSVRNLTQTPVWRRACFQFSLTTFSGHELKPRYQTGDVITNWGGVGKASTCVWCYIKTHTHGYITWWDRPLNTYHTTHHLSTYCS